MVPRLIGLVRWWEGDRWNRLARGLSPAVSLTGRTASCAVLTLKKELERIPTYVRNIVPCTLTLPET